MVEVWERKVEEGRKGGRVTECGEQAFFWTAGAFCQRVPVCSKHKPQSQGSISGQV